MSDAREEHPSITTQRHLNAIADLWPELEQQLGRSGSSDGEKISAQPGSKPPIDSHVADVMAEIQSWAVYLGRVLLDETDWTPPPELDTPGILRDIARWRVGHFTADNYDEMARLAFIDDAATMHTLALKTARPSGVRRIPLHVTCHQTTMSDETHVPIACEGQYYALLVPDQPMRDIVCDQDDSHRMTPLQWNRALRSGAIEPGVNIA